ncbi:MAG: nucleotidyl transferase AbiEii/AbiGii toxin family protein [Clostridia bacterium]|nr:nucleotidyl transferase AbiEii/AbiGii toxin family protein [Clostridia bacterium]
MKGSVVPYSARLFWDVPEEAIDWEAHAEWVIARVLERGTPEELEACIRQYGWARVERVALHQRGLPDHIRAFWSWYVRGMGEEGALHTEILPPGALELLKRLKSLLPGGTMLCGGTAVALYLGHRRSRDLDFLTGQPFDASLLAGELRGLCQEATVDSLASNTLHATLQGLKVSFIRQPGIELVAGATLEGVPVGDLDTLLALKLNAVAGRGSRRDFVDLYALCQTGLGVHDLLRLARTRLHGLNEAHLLRSLVYFKDAEREPMPELLAGWSWADARRFFEEGVRRYLDQLRLQGEPGR